MARHRNDDAADGGAPQTLIDADSLRRRLESGERTVLLDVRWALGKPDGRAEYLAAHIPGAVYVDLETELAAPASAAEGRHPLPDAAAFAASARGWGINDDDVVVAYDDGGNLSAARLWWLLRHCGFTRVYLLDGGLGAWRAAGAAVAGGDERAEPGRVELGWGQMPTLEIGDVAEFAGQGALLDARAAERYRGEIEPVDPKAGHIPGAVSAPTAANLGPDGRFLPAETLRARFAALGAAAAGGTAVYCGSGVSAAHEIAALAQAGIDAALYPGSFSQWSARDDLPVAG